jgi:ERF superfamily
MKLEQSESIKELVTALSKAQGEMAHAAMTGVNPAFKNVQIPGKEEGSRYATLKDVIDAWRPVAAPNGLSVLQTTDVDEGKIYLHTQISHSSGEWVRSTYPVTPRDNSPQAVGSAITYARRYHLSTMCLIAADDDDDGNAAQGIAPKTEKKAEPKPEKKEEVKDERTPIQKGQSILERVKSSTTEASLEAIIAYKEYQPTMAALMKEDRALWDSIVKAIGDKRKELGGGLDDNLPPFPDTRMAG